MRVVLTALLVLPMAAASAQVLTVCEALDQLSELNGKEVEIRGAWQAGDTGEWLWAPEPCSHPIVRDGWVWKNTISVKREDANDYRRWRTISAQWSALKHGSPGPNLVLATLKGRLKTRDHFKVSRFSHLPEAYGYSPAVLVVSKAEHLQAVPCSNEQLARAEKEAVSRGKNHCWRSHDCLRVRHFRLGGRVLDRSNAMTCTTCYPAWDHLGSTRLLMDQNANVIARHDYLPFGEEILANTAGRNSQWGPLNDTVAQKFTGQTRDSETAIDFFNARYFGPALGRFTSPDPANAGADIMNPQSWNAYAYVLGNPLNAVDPSGMDPNYAGYQQGYCPASQAVCPMGTPPVVGSPTFPGELEAAYERYAAQMNAMFWGNVALYFAYQQDSPDLTTLSGQLSHLSGMDIALNEAAVNGDAYFTATVDNAAQMPANLPAGTPQVFWGSFTQGFNAAIRALKKKNCSNFYGGNGPATMGATEYRFLPLKNATLGLR